MSETNKVAIIDPEGADKVLNILESTETADVFGIVILDSDGADL